MAKVSIVIPVFNSEKYLSKCIESVLGQEEQDIEIILVDDGSTDLSVSICERYKEKDSRIVLLVKKNGGPHSARKAGVKLASSPYVAFVDSDDWIGKTLFTNMLTIMQDNTIDCVLGSCTCIDANSVSIMRNQFNNGKYIKSQLENIIYERMLCPFNSFKQNIIPSLCGKLFKKELIAEIMDMLDDDICIGEDLACTFRYLLTCNSIYIHNDNCEYYYEIRNGTNSSRYDSKYFNKAIRLTSFLKQTVRDFNYDFLIDNINRYTIYIIYREIGIAISLSDRKTYKCILSDIEKNANSEEFIKALQSISLKCLEIGFIDRYLLICLARRNLALFRSICLILFYNNKRKIST